MTQRGDKDATDAVKVAFAVGVPIVKPVRPGDDEWVFKKASGLLIVDKGVAQETLLTFGQLHEVTPNECKKG